MFERQVGWLEAREKSALSTSALLRSKDENDHTFQPKRFSKSNRKTHTSARQLFDRGSPQKKCGLIAHDLHIRRYARARADKDKKISLLTRSSTREQNELEVSFLSGIFETRCSTGRENVKN